MRFYNTKIDIPEDFFKEEIRNGYTVTSKMKKAWAIQIDILKEMERICDKYNITYYADSGSMLGVVRNNQYIPWDDDIDVSMLRADYDRFMEVAPKELKHPYVFQSINTEECYIRVHAQIRNTETTGMINWDIEMPYDKGIFIDIFPLDGIPDSKAAQRIQHLRLSFLWKLLSTYRYNSHMKGVLPKILCGIAKPIYKIIDYRKVYAHYDRLCAKYSDRNTKKISYVTYTQADDRYLYDRSDYATYHKEKFEFTDINIPDGYDGILTTEYGDYMKPANIPSCHGETIIEPEIPYKKYIEDNYETAKS